ncbi:MAG: hypothetical protein QME78_03130 [Thermodesulfobacteriota bacterium]|nr:hypothetical protein [Thermodesulfobacteriota bacterium]
MPKAIGEAHRWQARMVNFREGWRGFLWPGRFKSYAMDERYGVATEDEAKKLQQHERTGRPLGNEQFVMRLEQLTGRMLRKRKPGPKGAGKMENR